MRHVLVAAALLLTSSSTRAQSERPGVAPGLFGSTSILEATIEAPFANLIANGRRSTDYAVIGTVTFTDRATGRTTSVENVKISTRGHTSLRESECDFPKLKLDFTGARGEGSLFQGMSAVKVGTHCSDRPDGPGGKYGRWPNEKAAHREAFVYRLLDDDERGDVESAAGADHLHRPEGPSIAAAHPRRPCSSKTTTSCSSVSAGDSELPANQFGSATSVFAMPDLARLFFAQAMIGNFDWCLRMSPRDTYRCNDTTPIWNMVGVIKPEGMAVPVIHDFDIAGMVTTRHIWFGKVFNRAFAPSEAEIEVLAQVQRTRSVFPRDLLDATRSDLVGRKAAAYQVLGDSAMDDAGRQTAKAYLDAFFAAIETDEAFYRPVIVARTPIYLDADGSRPACTDEAPAGTPVGPALETAGELSRIVPLDALWQWAEKCEAVRLNPVWVPTAVISSRYPQ